MSEDDADRINAGLAAIEANVQRMTAEIDAFRHEAVAKLDAMIATCDRIRDGLRRRSDATRGFETVQNLGYPSRPGGLRPPIVMLEVRSSVINRHSRWRS